MGIKNWQSHLWGCPIKPLLGWHKPTQKEREHMQKMKEEVKKHDRKAEKKNGRSQ